ncbi:MAG: hypothetical protein ACPG5B_14810 [Chitinophagales bacterium]
MAKTSWKYILFLFILFNSFFACTDKTDDTSETATTTQIRFVNISPIPFDFFVKTNDTILFETPLSYGEISEFLPIDIGNIDFVFCEEQSSKSIFNVEISEFLADNDYTFFVVDTNFSENHFILRDAAMTKPSFVRFTNQSNFYNFDISVTTVDTSIYEQLPPFPTDTTSTTSSSIYLPANTYTFQLYEAIENTLLRTIDNIALNADSTYHINIGELYQSATTGEDTLDYEITKQAIEDTAYLSFIHAASNAPNLDILVINTVGDTIVLHQNLAFLPPNTNNFTTFLPCLADTYNLHFLEAGTPITLLEIPDIQLNIHEEKTFLIRGLIENQANEAPLEVVSFP